MGKDKKKSSRRSRSRSRSKDRKSRSRDRKSKKRTKRSRSRERSKRKKSSNFDSGALKTALAAAGGGPTGAAYALSHNAIASAQHMHTTRTSRRVYVGNLPHNIGLTESLLQEFFTSILTSKGILTEQPVVSVALKQGSAFCFVELRAVADAHPAMIMLQGTTLGVNTLKVARPSDWTNPLPHLSNFVVPLTVSQMSTNPPVPVVMPIAASPTHGSSKVLVLHNLLTSEDVEDEGEYQDILVDIEYECHKHGQVEKLVIIKDPLPIKVFVVFIDRVESFQASTVLQTKAFKGRKLNPIYYDETLFAYDNYDG